MGSSVYEIVTDRIVALLEKNIVPWRQPWATSLPKNLVSKKVYRGVNVFVLGSMGYASPWWLSFKQAKALGGSVRKGEKATPIIFWTKVDKSAGKKDKESDGHYMILRFYNGFNVLQCEGIEVPKEEKGIEFSPIGECEHIVACYPNPPTMNHGGDRACYSPPLDSISMPHKESFHSVEEYYSTLFHEMTHSTGAEKRLGRKGVTDPIKFGSHDYSFEELVAECGAAFLCAHTGIVNRTIDNSVAYIKHWAEKLRSEPKWIVQASSEAAKACDHILGVKYGKEDEGEE